jgi:hypothetical protein
MVADEQKTPRAPKVVKKTKASNHLAREKDVLKKEVGEKKRKLDDASLSSQRQEEDARFSPVVWSRIVRVLFKCGEAIVEVMHSPKTYSFVYKLKTAMQEKMTKTARSESCIFLNFSGLRESKSGFAHEKGFLEMVIKWTQGAQYLSKLVPTICSCAEPLTTQPSRSCNYCPSPSLLSCPAGNPKECAHRFKHLLDMTIELLRFFSLNKKVFLDNMVRFLQEDPSRVDLGQILETVSVAHTTSACVQAQKCICDRFNCDVTVQTNMDHWHLKTPAGDFQEMQKVLKELVS